MGKGYVDLNRLCDSMFKSYQAMQVFREVHLDAARALAGSRYSEDGAKKKTYLNLISLYVNIVSRSLISKSPRVLLRTFLRDQQPSVNAMQEWLNHEIERSSIAEQFKRVVIDALFSVGIMKVGIATPADAAVANWNLHAGDPYMRRIDLEDLVWDTNARDFSELAYIGHRIHVPKAIIESSKLYNKKAREKLATSENSRYNRTGEAKTSAIGRNEYAADSELEDMVDLWEVYVPQHRCIYTLADDDIGGASVSRDGPDVVALREMDWIGPDTGPYHILSFGIVPGNLFPKAPVQDVIDLHEAANNVYRKLVRQAHDQKEILLSMGSADDVDRIQKTPDGGAAMCESPDKTKVQKYGGPDQGLFLFIRELIERFSFMAGNLVVMGGLASQAGTAKQEELLASQSSGQVASMQDSTLEFVSECMRSLGWFWWHHPQKMMQYEHTLPGLPDIGITRRLYPNRDTPELMGMFGLSPKEAMNANKRTAPWDALHLKVDPYSMRHTTPQQRANDLTAFITQIYAPLAQVAAQQGVALDMPEFIRVLSEYRDMPEMQNILTVQEPAEDMGGGGQGSSHQRMMPPETTRNYVRKSEASSKGQDAQMEAILEMGANNNGQLQGV